MAQGKRFGRHIGGGRNVTPESLIEDLKSSIEDLGDEVNAVKRQSLQLGQTVAEMRAEMREIHEQLAEQGEN